MIVERIYVRAAGETAQAERERIELVAGMGIAGDRNYGLHHEPGQNVTLVEAEEIEAYLREQARPHDLSITHRNLVTRGVRLNELLGREFRIGKVRLRGMQLCEPCLGLGEMLAGATIDPAAVVKRFVHRAGLCADVLCDGVIERGAAIRLDDRA